MERKIGSVIALVVLVAVGVIVYFNLQPHEPPGVAPQLLPDPPLDSSLDNALAGIENPIGETKQNQMKIAAVWLPAIQMAGVDLPQDPDVIHLEADIHATEGNVNGFGRGAWIPYMTVRYEIIPLDSDNKPVEGPMIHMVAKDGPHYGATLRMPGPGKYRLTYHLEPPDMGRHVDPITGVAPWWEPFSVEFEFNYAGSKQ